MRWERVDHTTCLGSNDARVLVGAGHKRRQSRHTPVGAALHSGADTVQIVKVYSRPKIWWAAGLRCIRGNWYTIEKWFLRPRRMPPFRDADQHGCVENTETATCQITLCDQTTFQTFANLH